MQHDSPAQFAPLDRQAFQSFYRENLGPIYRFVYSKVRNREEAEDLISQIFIKAVRNIDRAQNPQSIRSWLFQVARTTIADYWRTYYRRATSSLDELLEAGWEGPAENEGEDTLLELSCSPENPKVWRAYFSLKLNPLQNYGLTNLQNHGKMTL